ncbi:MAG: flagellar biosynthetic protein FliO [Lachnospiraceae bacterium]|nr:flagellar biosynthetic protein FliO [Lachnospiraceae bacterium]MBR4815862.1 flagellar biosynthetic protein FliO [Lachnospiraceae bacterium]
MPYFLYFIAEIAGKAVTETSKTAPLDGGGIKSILKLIGLIILCILIIAASYFTTKFVGKKQIAGNGRSNFKSIDVFRVTPNKYLQIVEVGKRYFCIAVTKESITLICELKEDELKTFPLDMKPKSFKEQMNELMHRKKQPEQGSGELGDIAKLTLSDTDDNDTEKSEPEPIETGVSGSDTAKEKE